MPKPVRVLIPFGLGLNCEEETAYAFRRVGAEVDLVHLTDLFHHRGPARITDYQIVAFVGGFAYGDHIAGGFVLATRIRAHLEDDLREFLRRSGLVLGICNGFQTLVRLGLLPGSEGGSLDFVPRATLAANDRLGYRDAWVTLGVEQESLCVWTRGLDRLELPSRHGEGKFLVDSEQTLRAMERRGQIAVRYLDSTGRPTMSWPDNPNGSPGAVAGVCDPTGRIFGLMPHPDAYLHPSQHPAARRRKGWNQETDGLRLFRNGVEAAAELSR